MDTGEFIHLLQSQHIIAKVVGCLLAPRIRTLSGYTTLVKPSSTSHSGVNQDEACPGIMDHPTFWPCLVV